jgi:hypothetical protein
MHSNIPHITTIGRSPEQNERMGQRTSRGVKRGINRGNRDPIFIGETRIISPTDPLQGTALKCFARTLFCTSFQREKDTFTFSFFR